MKGMGLRFPGLVAVENAISLTKCSRGPHENMKIVHNEIQLILDEHLRCQAEVFQVSTWRIS